MITITDTLYNHVATALHSRLASDDWFNGTVSGTYSAARANAAGLMRNVAESGSGEVTVSQKKAGESSSPAELCTAAIELGTTGFATQSAAPDSAIDEADGDSATAAPTHEPAPDFDWSLKLTAVIYRRDEITPEGPRRPIADIVPVWWEFTTETIDGPVLNDFSFSDLKTYLIDSI